MTGQREDITDAGRRDAPVEPVLYAARDPYAHGGAWSLATEIDRPKPKPRPVEWAADD